MCGNLQCDLGNQRVDISSYIFELFHIYIFIGNCCGAICVESFPKLTFFSFSVVWTLKRKEKRI